MRQYWVLVVAVLACLEVAPAWDLEPIEPPSLPFNPTKTKSFFDFLDPVGASPRIVGGVEAKPHSFPHQVGLNVTMGNRHGFCGGSLLSDRWIVTAAHCADGVSNITAILGSHNIKDQESTKRLVPVEEIHVHPRWLRVYVRNDIALLKLQHAVSFDEYVKPIQLPKVSQKSDSFWNREVIMSGWGKENDRSTTISPVLRNVSSRIVSNLYCNFRYFFAVIQDTHICASGWWARGTCIGDSGGPLMVEEEGQKTLVGLTSFGIGFGCQWSWPPVFTRITSYLDWIHQTTGIAPRQ